MFEFQYKHIGRQQVVAHFNSVKNGKLNDFETVLSHAQTRVSKCILTSYIVIQQLVGLIVHPNYY